MNPVRVKKIFIAFIIIVLIVPLPLLAQTNPCTQKPANLGRCVNQIYVWSLGIASLLALLMMVLGSYYYMTSQGNAEQAGKGKDMIIQSLMGIVLLFAAYLLLNTINPDLVNLKLKTTKEYCEQIRGSASSDCK